MTTRTYTVYRAGQFNGAGPVLWMFRYLRADGSFGSCEAVEQGDLRRHVDALQAIGYSASMGDPKSHSAAQEGGL